MPQRDSSFGGSLVINRHVGVYVRLIPETPGKEVTSRL